MSNWAEEYGQIGGGSNGGNWAQQHGQPQGLGIIKNTTGNIIFTSIRYYIVLALIVSMVCYYYSFYFEFVQFGEFFNIAGFEIPRMMSFARFTIDNSILLNSLIFGFLVTLPIPYIIHKSMKKIYGIGKHHISGSQLYTGKEARKAIIKEFKKKKKEFSPRIFLGRKNPGTVWKKIMFKIFKINSIGLVI